MKIIQIGDDGLAREVEISTSDVTRRLAELAAIGDGALYAESLRGRAAEHITQLSPLNDGRDQRGQR